MVSIKKNPIIYSIGLVALVNLGVGLLLAHSLMIGGGAAAFGYIAVRVAFQQLVAPRWRRSKRSPLTPPAEPKPQVKRAATPVDSNDTEALLKKLIGQHRASLLLRPQIAGNLNESQLSRATKALNSAMAMVPDGQVVLGQLDDDLEDGRLEDDRIRESHARVVNVEHFFLDRHPVTNRHYQEFVAAGGYEQMTLWDKSIWPAMLDFVDQTGEPGPRYWRGCCCRPGLEDHPVVGVSWFEAAAYARWIGKRLVTNAEWVKAACWPVALSPNTRIQRRYPWGDTMDLTRANLWGSEATGTVAVDEFPGGVSVGGVHQLIGNVWEWTSGDFQLADPDEGLLIPDSPMKSIRGGAFDTYFDNQATCQFQSGEAAVARKNNIGFRCALGVSDLSPARTAPAGQQGADLPVAAAEEILA